MARFFYNTNGFAFHRLEDAAAILSDLGYDGIALTPDVHHLDPWHTDAAGLARMGRIFRQQGLEVVLETGARFVLDARRKHHPTLLHPRAQAERRVSFLRRCLDMASGLDAPVVSLWAGVRPPEVDEDLAFERLVTHLRDLCEQAATQDVRIGFEPEPGMLLERATDWPRLRDAVGHPALGLTLDVGHCLATREGAPEDAIRTHAADLLVLQVDDHRPGVHDHLAFGEGEVDFHAVAQAVDDVGFDGPIEVELSRHSATAPATARASLDFLKARFPPSG